MIQQGFEAAFARPWGGVVTQQGERRSFWKDLGGSSGAAAVEKKNWDGFGVELRCSRGREGVLAQFGEQL